MNHFPIHVRPDATIIDQIANIALGGAGLGVLIFTVCYMVFFKWHKTTSGIAILLFTTSLSLVLLLGIISRATGGDYFLRDWFRLLAYALCLVTAWGLVAVLVHGWMRGRKPLNLLERDSVRRAQTGPLYDPDADTIPDHKEHVMTITKEPEVILKPTTVGEVAKAVIYIALAALGILITALADNHLSAVELIQTAIVVAGVVPVYLIAGTIPKTISAFVVAALQSVLLLVADGTGFAEVSIASWLGVIVAAFAAIGVAVVPNSGKPGLVEIAAPVDVVPVTRAEADARRVQTDAARASTGDAGIG